MSTVLVTGATGFVGARLVPALLDEGHEVRAMTRRPDDYSGPAKPVHGDVHDPGTLSEALEGVDVAVYLVHSLGDEDFEQMDADAARGFGLAAAASGVRQIVYLGGLGSEEEVLSAHLRSRREVERLLGEAGVPVTVLRAAIVVGSGGVSWEMTRRLVKNLPAMVVPRWASTLTQPIAISDVVRYIAGVVDREEALGRVFEVGGADRLTYAEMLARAGKVMHGRRLPIIHVPLGTPFLSQYWIKLFTGVDATTAANLISSMGNEVVVTDDSIRDLVPEEPMTYVEAVQQALEDDRAG